MSVAINPLELAFRRPFTSEVAQILKITNPNNQPVAFKVKTTAPKQYCVRPNSGRIEPGATVDVSVLLQAMKQEPPLDVKCRDKFLVQSCIITSDKEFSPVQQIWETVQKADIQEKKIRVAWLPPIEELRPFSTPSRRDTTNGTETPDTAAPAYTPAPPAYETTLDETPSVPIKQEPVETTSFISTVPPAPTQQSAAIDSSQATIDELRQQLSQAEETIAQLKRDMDSGLRQRKVASSAEKEEKSEKVSQAAAELAQVSRRGTEGVPVPIAALLCLASFLLAYFLF